MIELIRRLDALERRLKDLERMEAGTSGTFTPAYGGTSTNGSITYTTQSGTYWRVGSLCYIRLRLVINVLTTAPTGTLLITGLPFTVTNAAATVYDTLEVWHSSLNVTNATTDVVAIATPNGTRLEIWECTDAIAAVGVNAANIVAATQLMVSGWFTIA